MTTLSVALRERTADAHRRLERGAFAQRLIAGRLGKPDYLLLLRSLRELYAALESGLRAAAAHPAVAPIRDARLDRLAALEGDLLDLHGPDWRTALPVQPCAADAAARLERLAAAAPERLAAHAYVRYLGDLNGGQLLQRAIARALGQTGPAGLRFYVFDAPATKLAAALRDGLDRIAPAAHAAIVDEADRGFALHEQLFAELGAACGHAQAARA